MVRRLGHIRRKRVVSRLNADLASGCLQGPVHGTVWPPQLHQFFILSVSRQKRRLGDLNPLRYLIGTLFLGMVQGCGVGRLHEGQARLKLEPPALQIDC